MSALVKQNIKVCTNVLSVKNAVIITSDYNLYIVCTLSPELCKKVPTLI